SCVFYRFRHPRVLHSFPPRRSSDLRPLIIGSRIAGNRILVAIWKRLARKLRPTRISTGSISRMPAAAESAMGKKDEIVPIAILRSEEHTSELQSRENLVCRLLLEKK